MTDEAKNAEAELAKVIREALESSFEDVMSWRRGVDDGPTNDECLHHHGEVIASAIFAAGYRKRSDVLEEAAKVAESMADGYAKEWRAGLKSDSRIEAFSDAADNVAQTIRNLKDKQ